jgi:hypothetical protein
VSEPGGEGTVDDRLSCRSADEAAPTRVRCRCFEIIDWKKKYGKYKPRRQPGKCLGCDDKTVSQAYHQLCPPCSSSRRVCAKCMQAPPAPPGPEELEARAALAQVRSRALFVSCRWPSAACWAIERITKGEGSVHGP